MTAVFAGFVLGLTVAAGFGPISVLALSSGLSHGFQPAFGVGLGAALVDGLYAFLAALGLTALIGPARAELQLVGGVALLFIGVRMARPSGATALALGTFRRGLLSSAAATLANPLTIASWAAAFTAVVPELGLSQAETIVVLPPCVALGTLTYFTGLAALSTWAGERLGPNVLRRVSTIAGVVIAAFGVVFLVRGLDAIL